MRLQRFPAHCGKGELYVYQEAFYGQIIPIHVLCTFDIVFAVCSHRLF